MSACIDCSSWNSRVLESRRRPETGWHYRRRECMDCGTRWATYEVPAQDVQVGQPDAGVNGEQDADR